MIVFQAVLIGVVVLLVGTIPRNIMFAANLRYYPSAPWSVPLIAIYLWVFWLYLSGGGPPKATAHERKRNLRSNPVRVTVWFWALVAGGLGIVALVLGLRVANRLVVLPQQQLPDLGAASQLTVISLLLMAAPVAGIVEEAAFRGFMQRPIERRYGLPVAILITGTMFAIVHMDFTPILWPYYVAVAAIYGTVAYLTQSILPAVVLHTGGNLYSNFDLWKHGNAEWQASSGASNLISQTGVDAPFVNAIIVIGIVVAAMVWAYSRLARVVSRSPAVAQ